MITLVVKNGNPVFAIVIKSTVIMRQHGFCTVPVRKELILTVVAETDNFDWGLCV